MLRRAQHDKRIMKQATASITELHSATRCLTEWHSRTTSNVSRTTLFVIPS